MTLALAFAIGFLAGLRAFTPPAITAWAAYLGWLQLPGVLGLIGSLPAVTVFSLLAAGELVGDKMPWIPNRTSIPALLVRVLTGKITGTCIAAAFGEHWVLGLLLGGVGAVVGCFLGYVARTRTVRALRVPDLPVALLEDLIAIGGCLWIVTRLP